jgi:chemotaxis regulatin CheY-phosphate phosphatase CheZ
MENKISVSYDCYKSVMSDNDNLRSQLGMLKKELEENKADHTMDKARVVYAYHILNAGRDEHVLMHMDDKAKEVVFYKMKYDQVYSEMDHYKKSQEAWIKKYDGLFQKHQETLQAIRELENEIDRLQNVKRCCR